MISPHTPPGTRVVISWLACTVEDYLSVIAPNHRKIARSYIPEKSSGKYDIGMTFILDYIESEDIADPPFIARLVGEEVCFPLKVLSIVPLPQCLIDLVIDTPVFENA